MKFANTILLLILFSMLLAHEPKPMELKINILDKHEWLNDGMGVEGVGLEIRLPELLFISSNTYLGLMIWNLDWLGTKEENPSLYNSDARLLFEEKNWRTSDYSGLGITLSRVFSKEANFFSHIQLTSGITNPEWTSWSDSKTLPFSEFGKDEPDYRYYDNMTYFFRASFRPVNFLPVTVSIQTIKVPERGWYPTFAFGFEPILIINGIKY